MEDIVGFSPDDANRIANAVLDAERRGAVGRPSQNEFVGTGVSEPRMVYEGFYEQDLDPSTEKGTVKKLADFRIWGGRADAWAKRNKVTVTNRDDLFSAKVDDYGKLIEINGELRPLHPLPVQIIRFTIATVTPSLTGTVNAVLAGTASPGTTVTLVDALGCLTKSVGLKGYAARMVPLPVSGTRQWEIIALCCA